MYQFQPKREEIYCGDNIDVLSNMAEDSIDQIYLDPPFFTSKKFEVIFGDNAEIRAFEDRWAKMGENGRYSKDVNMYLEFMESRIRQLYRILKPTGTLYLHCDHHADSYLRILCDQIFQGKGFYAPIIWKRSAGHSLARGVDIITDTILLYTKSENYTFNQQYITSANLEKEFPYVEEDTGRRFNHQKLEKSSNKRDGDKVRIIQGKEVTTTLGWVWSQETFDKRLAENPNLIYWTNTGRPRYKIYQDESKGKKLANLWDDIPAISSNSGERIGYPTQKPEALLERIINTSSNKGDLVLDPFCGCGTTLAVAKRLKRNFIGIDISPTACRLIAKRIGFPINQIIGLPLSAEEIQKMDGFEFQNAVIRALDPSGKTIKIGNRGADGGIDGSYFDLLISVKKFRAGRIQLDEFIATLHRNKQQKGIFIAEGFSSEFIKENARLKREDGIIIYTLTLSEIIDERKHENIIRDENRRKGKLQ